MKKIISLITVILLAGTAYCGNMSVVMVGNKAIVESDVQTRMREENKNYDDALRELVVEKMLVFQAEREKIEATADEVSSEEARIKSNFPDEKAFLEGLEKENMPYAIFLKKIEDSIKVRKLVRKNVTDRLRITIPEITAKMKELEGKGSFSYNVRMKWFESEPAAADFADKFDASKENDMGEAIWLSSEDIVSEVLTGLEKVSKGGVSRPIKVGSRYLVVLLKDVAAARKPDAYSLYNKARIILQNMKFAEAFDNYLKELEGKIPVFYSN